MGDGLGDFNIGFYSTYASIDVVKALAVLAGVVIPSPYLNPFFLLNMGLCVTFFAFLAIFL